MTTVVINDTANFNTAHSIVMEDSNIAEEINATSLRRSD